MEERRAPQFAPVDLDLVPEVDALLTRLGMGPFRRTEVTAPPGRNDIWIGPTESGRHAFVKRLVGSPGNVRERLDRLAAFERARPAISPLHLRVPELLALEEATALCAFAHVDDAVPGYRLAEEGRFGPALTGAAGRALGAVHASSAAELAVLDNSPPHMPDPRFLVGLPEGVYENLTMAELDSWRMLQQDREVCLAIDALCAAEGAAPKVPSHCDLRLDQFLVVGEKLYVTDWEEFRLADPARDIGNFVGQWLQQAMLDIVSGNGDSVFRGVDLTHEVIMERGAAALRRQRPLIERFWAAYRDQRGGADPGLAERATAFAGWHLLDRLLAAAGRSSRVAGIERAAAGVGRAALVRPERFAAALGLGEPS
ncbi:class V lanthionine synthetase subunit LxmK [Nocardiopsis mangrovi]|uniref:Class V lanthionine synthetase subunit LxmK n=1 Tax=Nocardiopsis mangrovi TaxID=1179818 RepID=A0ABV9E309_9ACTN